MVKIRRTTMSVWIAAIVSILSHRIDSYILHDIENDVYNENDIYNEEIDGFSTTLSSLRENNTGGINSAESTENPLDAVTNSTLMTSRMEEDGKITWRITLYRGERNVGNFSDLAGDNETCKQVGTGNERVGSVNTYGKCVRLYKKKNCAGDFKESRPASHCDWLLGPCGMQNKIASVSSCSYRNANDLKNTISTTVRPSTVAPIQKTYSRKWKLHLYRGIGSQNETKSLSSDGSAREECQNVSPTKYLRVASVNTHGTCVRLYTDFNCKGRFEESKPGSNCDWSLEGCNMTNRIASASSCFYSQDINNIPATTLSTFTEVTSLVKNSSDDGDFSSEEYSSPIANTTAETNSEEQATKEGIYVDVPSNFSSVPSQIKPSKTKTEPILPYKDGEPLIPWKIVLRQAFSNKDNINQISDNEPICVSLEKLKSKDDGLIDSLGRCVQLYEGESCSGDFIEIKVHGDCDQATEFSGFANKFQSASSCFYPISRPAPA